MNKKSFLLGLLTGVVLIFIVIIIIGYVAQKSGDDISINYLETPVSYENKTETSFKVFQVIGEAALASEISNREFDLYNGNTVMILGTDFYSDQIVTVYNPKRVGTYSYTNNAGMPMTVPVIDRIIK